MTHEIIYSVYDDRYYESAYVDGEYSALRPLDWKNSEFGIDDDVEERVREFIDVVCTTCGFKPGDTVHFIVCENGSINIKDYSVDDVMGKTGAY